MPQLQFDDIVRFDQQNGFRAATHGGMKSPQQQPTWPWSETQDWTLMDTAGIDQHCTARNNANHQEALKFDQIPAPYTDQERLGMLQTGWHPHELFSTINTKTRDGVSAESGHGHTLNGDSTFSTKTKAERPTTRQNATHTLHVHDSDAQSEFGMNNSDGTSVIGKGPQCPRTALAQIVLRLIGTVKAVRAFGSLLKPQSPSALALRPVSMSKSVPIFASHGKEATNPFLLGSAQTHNAERTGGFLPVVSGNEMTVGPPRSENAAQGALEGMRVGDYLRMTNPFLLGSRRPPHSQLHSPVPLALQLENVRSEPAAQGVLEGMRIGDYLRMKNNFAIDEANLSQHPLRPSSSHDANLSDFASRSEHLASTSVPVSSAGTLVKESTAPEGRPTFSPVGEGISARSSSPSTELFMLKRRIGGAKSRSAKPASTLLTPSVLQTKSTASVGSSGSDQPETRSYISAYGYAREMRNTESHARYVHGANGGAYPRLNSDSTAQAPAASATISWPSNVHSGFSGTGISTGILNTAANTDSPSERFSTTVSEERLSDHVRYRDHHGRPETSENRLSDHVRYRDHHGRPDLEGLKITDVLALIAGALLLSALLSSSANSTLLLLALLCPVPGTKGRHARERAWRNWSSLLQPMLQCSIPNSSWLAVQKKATTWYSRVQNIGLCKQEVDSMPRKGKCRGVMQGWVIKWSSVAV